ncbi:MAG: hypothetical protein COU63_00115 [Candidatus Pacebacteria bacterium CG10_big_fil_rev_8_21_14_0_10_36_11]|nr:thermonuclease family protein [Candidatus Pacearchaeota archaeon]OIP74165.1 MAG: hypothetical protein AUK08_02865 [Candidatus Pacebacteria bacterium CG2_30_36_39]PIR65069.1 MAG: hypothetical protein COU63_00115 [Candidatus Pacebacteria bacterium CG10_big_fil_rev_8_21_14_0_10_36_11]PJC43229.1 MAG: hypothetical protein CO040_00240 [Candidatus Pacebacteria bacterium CG_4_9_14_0_2_um_filter_36_8]
MKISLKSKSFYSLLSLVFIAIYSLFQLFQEHFVLGDATQKPLNDEVLVTRVVDGDTFEIESGEKVRLIGIDAPETVHPQQPVECYGKVSSETLKKLIEGKQVTMEKDVSETDRYGRLLRYVYIDGQSINEFLVQEGFAYASSYPPDVAEQTKLKDLQQQAMVSGKGLWGTCEVNNSQEINDFLKQKSF